MRAKSTLVDTCANLTNLHRRSGRQRRRVTCFLVCFGAILWPIGMLVGFLRAMGFIDGRAGPDGFHFGYALPGLFAVLLAVQPIDTKLIRYTGLMLLLYCNGGTIVVLGALLLAGLGLDFEADRTCTPDHKSDCVAFLWHWSGVGLAAACGAIALVHVEFRGRHELTPRALLNRLWLIVRATYFGFGTATWLYIIARAATDRGYFGSAGFWGQTFHGTSDVILPLLLGRPMRRRLTQLLHHLTGDRDDGRAAAIAAMVGGVGVERAADLAEKSFRAITHEKMEPIDFLSSDLASSNDDLRARTVGCKLGFADAFMSHSWRDDAAAKWHTLGTWASAFSEAHDGRSPMLWFDRACLDQANIDASLSMLPIYLSGCKLLLILAGETYTERLCGGSSRTATASQRAAPLEPVDPSTPLLCAASLSHRPHDFESHRCSWCVMEVFTWLSIHKDAQSLMSVLPLVPPMRRDDEMPGDQPELEMRGRGEAAPADDVGSADEGEPRRAKQLWTSAGRTLQERTAQAERAHSSFVRFRADGAQCFRECDRDRLLAIIESSFGTFHEFDKRVRAALVCQSKPSELGATRTSARLNVRDVTEIVIEGSRLSPHSSHGYPLPVAVPASFQLN